MHFINSITASLLLVGSALAQMSPSVTVHVVSVSSVEKNTLKFTPNNVQAKPGDMVQFQFRNGNHTVTQSTFSKPCIPINKIMPNVTGFWSGFQPVSQGAASIPTYTIMVNDTKPIWFYCSQGKHCQAGMVGAVNAATSGNKTIEAFMSLAALVGTSSSTAAPGTVVAASSSMSDGSGYYSTTASGSTATAGATTSTTASASTAVSSGGAAGSLFAGSQQILTGFSMAALLSAVLL